MKSQNSKKTKLSEAKVREALRKMVLEVLSEEERSAMIDEADDEDTGPIDKTKYNTVQMLVSHPEKRRLKQLAAQDGVSISNFLRGKLSKFLDKLDTGDKEPVEKSKEDTPKDDKPVKKEGNSTVQLKLNKITQK